MTRKLGDISKHGRFKIDPEQYRKTALDQRKVIREAADCIELGEPFSDRDMVVTALRARAEQKWRGRRPATAPASREPERAAIRNAADQIEQGEEFDPAIVAKALRGWANSLGSSPPLARGRPHKLDQAAIALEWESQKRKRQISDSKLLDELAAKYCVEPSTIREAVHACGDAAHRHFETMIRGFGAVWKK